MNTTARTTLIAIAALVVGGLAVYGYETTQPISVTSTDVAMNAPSGDAALAHARTGIAHLDAAATAISIDDFDVAKASLEAAKSEFQGVAEAAQNTDQPIIVAQEAVIVNRFSPDTDVETFGTADTAGAEAGAMTISRGNSTTPLALQDYTINFGDLNVDTQAVIKNIDAALTAANSSDKSKTEESIKAARGAITFAINGEEAEEE